MTDANHRDLAAVLNNVKGKVALSGYHCEILDKLYQDWNCFEAPVKQCMSVKQPRTEVLWTNYDLTQNLDVCQNQLKSSQPLLNALTEI